MSSDHQPTGLRPWQFFVLAALGCATATTWIAKSDGVMAVVLLTVIIAAAALAALAAYRTVGPLVGPLPDRTPMVGYRTRAALEREKALTLRAIKDLEFDRAMKKVSEDDFREMSAPLRGRAARLIRQLDASVGYRSHVERDLAKRLGDRATVDAPRDAAPSDEAVEPRTPATRTCTGCETANDADARFCKACGAKL